MRISLRFDFDDGERLGPGKADLLALIAEHGSIRAAGAAMGMSYRRAWLLVDTMNRMFERPLVETSHGGAKGGGAKLTETGREVLRLYRGMERNFTRSCAADIATLKDLAVPDATAQPTCKKAQR